MVAPEHTASTAGSTPVDASAGQPPAERDDLGSLRVQLLLVGVIIAAVLMTGVLVTWFGGPIPSSQTAGLADISGVPALNLQAFPAQPELGDPTPGILTCSGSSL